MNLRKLSAEEFQDILFEQFVDQDDTDGFIRDLKGNYIGEVLDVIVSPITGSMDIYVEEGFYSLYAYDLINHEFEELEGRNQLRAEIKDQSVVVVWNNYKQ